MDLIIVDELKYLFSAPSEFARNELRRQLVENGGPDDPIYISEAGHVLDGNNRLEICTEEALPYRTVTVQGMLTEDGELDTPKARAWAIRHQFCRRNVPPTDEYRYVAELVRLTQAQGVERSAAVAQVAAETGHSERQVWRDIATADALEAIPEEIREVAQSAGAKNIAALAALPPEEQAEVATDIVSGTPAKQAIRAKTVPGQSEFQKIMKTVRKLVVLMTDAGVYQRVKMTPFHELRTALKRVMK